MVAPRGSSEIAAAVAVNLAASFAETGKDVLLIEADLRTPVLASQLPTDSAGRPRWSQSQGGAQVGDTEWPDGRQLVVDAGESGSFDLIPGERVRNVPRALTSSRATRLVSEADSPNSTVVVLAPPVLSYADALALVDRVDGVLVVCDPGAVRRTDLSRIRELISGAGGTVLGAVLHAPLPGEKKRGRGKDGTTAGPEPRPAPSPGPSPRSREPQPIPYEVAAADASQHIPGDGTDTVALRTVRTGRR